MGLRGRDMICGKKVGIYGERMWGRRWVISAYELEK